MAKPLFFLGQFLRSPLRTGAIAPSSQHLAREMLRGLEFEPGDVVVEFGPGTGSFTRLLAQLSERGVRYIGIERNPQFLAILRKRFPQLTFVEGSAEDLAQHLTAQGLPSPKAVLSGLPLAAMPEPLQERIVAETSHALAGGGEFRQFSYCHFYPMGRALRQRMRDRFGSFSVSRAVIRNVPPAFVYIGRNEPITTPVSASAREPAPSAASRT